MMNSMKNTSTALLVVSSVCLLGVSWLSAPSEMIRGLVSSPLKILEWMYFAVQFAPNMPAFSVGVAFLALGVVLYYLLRLVGRVNEALTKSLHSPPRRTHDAFPESPMISKSSRKASNTGSPSCGIFSVPRQLAKNLDRLQNLVDEIPKFVANEALDRIMDGSKSSDAMECIEAAVLFVDIENFTGQLAARRRSVPDSLALLQQMSEAFDTFSQAVVQHGGIVDKVVGDCLVCFFPANVEPASTTTTGTPQTQWSQSSNGQPEIPRSLHEVRACLAAVDCLDRLIELHARWESISKPLLHIRMGIASGPCFCGNFGAPGYRVNYTVMSDVVNSASRLQSLAKTYRTRIVVSKAVVEAVMWHPEGSKLEFFSLGAETLRGRDSITTIYALSHPTWKTPTVSNFPKFPEAKPARMIGFRSDELRSDDHGPASYSSAESQSETSSTSSRMSAIPELCSIDSFRPRRKSSQSSA
jgi:class 3 adenylate cyclase